MILMATKSREYAFTRIMAQEDSWQVHNQGINSFYDTPNKNEMI